MSETNGYSYQIQAVSGDGAGYNGDVDATNATVTIPLQAPSNLQATANGAGEIDLSWDNNSQNNTGYIVTRSDGPTFTIDDPDQTWFSDTSVAAATSYNYTVAAKDDSFNESAPSDAASAATAGTLGVGFIYDSNGDLIGSTETQEGQSFTLDLTDKFAAGTTDPAASGWNIDWGDGHGETEGAGAGSYSHAYDEPGNYTITASTVDGSFAGTATDQVDIADGALSLTETDDRSSGTFSGTATFAHPKGHGAQTWYVDWGDGSYTSMGGPAGGNGDDSGSTADTQSLSHSYPSHGLEYTITISAQSDQGLWQTQTVFWGPGPQPSSAKWDAAGGGTAGVTDSGIVYFYDTSLEPTPGFPLAVAEQYTITFGDGNVGGGSTSGEQYDPNGAAMNTYKHAGAYYATLIRTIPNTLDPANPIVIDDSSFQANVDNPVPTLSTPAAQIVDAGQAVDISASYSGMPPGVKPVAFIDWGTGRGRIWPPSKEANREPSWRPGPCAGRQGYRIRREDIPV